MGVGVLPSPGNYFHCQSPPVRKAVHLSWTVAEILHGTTSALEAQETSLSSCAQVVLDTCTALDSLLPAKVESVRLQTICVAPGSMRQAKRKAHHQA